MVERGDEVVGCGTGLLVADADGGIAADAVYCIVHNAQTTLPLLNRPERGDPQPGPVLGLGLRIYGGDRVPPSVRSAFLVGDLPPAEDDKAALRFRIRPLELANVTDRKPETDAQPRRKHP